MKTVAIAIIEGDATDLAVLGFGDSTRYAPSLAESVVQDWIAAHADDVP